MMYNVQIIFINSDYGEFRGITAVVDQKTLDSIIDMSKSFYSREGFELTCEDGSFVVFPSNVVKNSILKLNYTKNE